MINLFQIIACYNEHEGFQRNSKASMKALQNVDSVIGRSKNHPSIRKVVKTFKDTEIFAVQPVAKNLIRKEMRKLYR